jgi:hypothetical protein
MKNLIFGLIAVLLSLNCFGQLNETNVGEFHNEKMDLYYSYLENIAKTKEKNAIKKSDFYDMFTNLTLNVFGKNNPELSASTNSEFLKYLDLTFEQQVDESVNKINKVTTISQELKSFLISIIVDCRKVNNNQLNINYLKSKMVEARQKFSGNELRIIEVSLNTGISSFYYWDNNYDKWETVFGTARTVRKPPVNVGVADLAGATVGALYGAVGGTAFLPGVGTVTGAIGVGLAGGLYSSTVAAAVNFFSVFF